MFLCCIRLKDNISSSKLKNEVPATLIILIAPFSLTAFWLLEKGVVAIIGLQSSAIAHMISEIANGLQVPVVSYAATDPTLSALQFSFFR